MVHSEDICMRIIWNWLMWKESISPVWEANMWRKRYMIVLPIKWMNSSLQVPEDIILRIKRSFFVKVTEKEMKHLGGVGLGGGTICGLSSIMLNTGDIHEIVPLSRKGDVAKIDLRIADLAKEKLPGLNLDVTASNFGKADAQSKPEDIAAGIVHMVIENICQAGILASMSTGIKEYILIGGLTKFFECRQIIEDFKSLWDVKISIPEYSDYATAIGSVIAPDSEKEEI